MRRISQDEKYRKGREVELVTSDPCFAEFLGNITSKFFYDEVFLVLRRL